MLDAERDSVFEGWIEVHTAILFKVSRVYGATHSDREDLFQEIALQLWHSVLEVPPNAAVQRRRPRDSSAPPAATAC